MPTHLKVVHGEGGLPHFGGTVVQALAFVVPQLLLAPLNAEQHLRPDGREAAGDGGRGVGLRLGVRAGGSDAAGVMEDGQGAEATTQDTRGTTQGTRGTTRGTRSTKQGTRGITQDTRATTQGTRGTTRSTRGTK